MVNVVFSSSNEYSPYLGVALYSLLKHNKDISDLKIYILHNFISNINKNKLNIIVKNYHNVSLIFVKVQNIEKLMDIEINKDLGIDTYSRLFISTFLPNDIDKVIYFDCDALILGSLKKLWDIDLGNNYCAGVLDLATPPFKKSVGLLPNDNYINGGFLLINLKKWREDNIESNFIDFLKTENGNVLNYDQGIINALFKNRILIVNPSYNFNSIYFEFDFEKIVKMYDLKNYYSKNVINKAKKNIVFLHFSGLKGRPWFINNNHPCKKFYFEYALNTPFKNDVGVKGFVSLKIKILNFCMKYIPSFLFINLYHFYVKTVFNLFN